MLDRLEQLLAAATPRPWNYEWNDRDDHEAGIDIMAAPPNGRVALVELSHFGESTHADAELIAAAVNALPDLLAVVEAAEFLRRDNPVCYDEATRLAIIAERERALDEAIAKLDEEDTYA